MPEIHKDFENLIAWHKNQKCILFIEKLLEYIYPLLCANLFLPLLKKKNGMLMQSARKGTVHAFIIFGLRSFSLVLLV